MHPAQVASLFDCFPKAKQIWILPCDEKRVPVRRIQLYGRGPSAKWLALPIARLLRMLDQSNRMQDVITFSG
jgi:hypothetical protein